MIRVRSSSMTINTAPPSTNRRSSATDRSPSPYSDSIPKNPPTAAPVRAPASGPAINSGPIIVATANGAAATAPAPAPAAADDPPSTLSSATWSES